jgi:hypothetical protein
MVPSTGFISNPTLICSFTLLHSKEVFGWFAEKPPIVTIARGSRLHFRKSIFLIQLAQDIVYPYLLSQIPEI